MESDRKLFFSQTARCVISPMDNEENLLDQTDISIFMIEMQNRTCTQ